MAQSILKGPGLFPRGENGDQTMQMALRPNLCIHLTTFHDPPLVSVDLALANCTR